MSKLRPLIETGFLYLRHGQSESNVRGLIGGATDYALTDQGRDEARSAGERLRGQVISAIYTSPLQRAYDTACIVAVRDIRQCVFTSADIKGERL